MQRGFALVVVLTLSACSRPPSPTGLGQDLLDGGAEPVVGGSGGTGGGHTGAPGGAAGRDTGGAGVLDAASGGTPDATVPADDATLRPDDAIQMVADAGPGADATITMTLPAPKDPPVPPIGEGWTEIFPTYKMDQPPGQVRHELTDGEFHLWLIRTDASTYPGRDSGPRSELHIRNNYTTGQAQYQADIKIDPNCSGVSVMQVFGGSRTATGFMAFVQGNNLTHYASEVIASNIRGRYFRLNVIHNTATHRVDVYIDGERRGGYEDHGPATHYFKCGLYHQRNMTPRCDAYFKNIRIFKK